MYKNRPTDGMFRDSVMASGRSPFFLSPSHPKPLHRRYLNMTGASGFTGAHHFAANHSTFNSANTVRKMVIVSMYQRTKLIEWTCGRCISTTSTTAIGRRSMGSSPSHQTQAIGSQAGQKLLRNSRATFLVTQMMQSRKESFSCYMGWGVLERLRFA